MGLLLVCPHCQTKLPLACRTCFGCGADLQSLSPQDRHYFIGDPCGPETVARAPGVSREPPPEKGAAEEVEPYPAIIEAEVVEPLPGTVAAAVVESYPEAMMPETPHLNSKDVSLCEALDRILNKGAVLFGEVMISVADIDLVYLGLQVILASVDTARGFKPPGVGQLGPNLFDKGASR